MSYTAVTKTVDSSDADMAVQSFRLERGDIKIYGRIHSPTGGSPVANIALCEAWNTVQTDFFGSPGLPVLELSRSTLGAEYLIKTLGLTLITFDLSKYNVDLNVGTVNSIDPAIPAAQIDAPDGDLAIPAGTDAYEILEMISEFARTPILTGGSPVSIPTATLVGSFSYSLTGFLISKYLRDNRNSTDGAAAGFPGGKVFDFNLIIAAGSTTRLVTDTLDGLAGPGNYPHAATREIYYQGGYDGQGATDASEGFVINLCTETEATAGRSFESRADVDHYKQWDVPVSHLNDVLVVNAGVQNSLSIGPVARGALEALIAKADLGTNMPASIYFEGEVVSRATPLLGGATNPTPLSGAEWPFDNTVKSWKPKLDTKGKNWEGAVRIPGVEAPTAKRRGFNCLSKPFSDNFKKISHKKCDEIEPIVMAPGFELFLMIAGVEDDFTEKELRRIWLTKEEYVDAVTVAADNLASSKYINSTDQQAYIDAANASAIGLPFATDDD